MRQRSSREGVRLAAGMAAAGCSPPNVWMVEIACVTLFTDEQWNQAACRLASFGSTGYCASTHASSPPTKACASCQPFSINICAARALEPSFGQVQ
jgi:hypothetical protein